MTLSAVLISSFVIAALGILGSIFQGKKLAMGWAFGFGSEVLWIISGVITAQWGLAIAGLGYASVAAVNFLKWRRDERPDTEVKS